jgi:hypothetical protein
MTIQLAEDIIAGMTTREEIELPYAQLDVVEYENEVEKPIVTIRALSTGQVFMEMDWHDESYKDNIDVRRLIKEATNETIMFVLFN